MLLLLPWAKAAGFSESLDDWQGDHDPDAGTLTDGEMTLETGSLTAFSLTARMQLQSGDGFALLIDDSAFVLNYTATGGLSLGDDSLPFSAQELAWSVDADPALSPVATWEEGGLSDPELIQVGDTWFLYYVAGTDQIGVATSTDLVSWTRFAEPIWTGTDPAAVRDGDTVVLFTTCGTDICRASADDGLSFVDDGSVLSGATDPGVARDTDGTWHLWTTDEDGTSRWRTSSDGLGFGDETDVDARLAGLDPWIGAYGFEAVYSLGDGLAWTVGGADGTYGSGSSDLAPIVEDNDASWSDGGLGDACAWVDAPETHLFFSGGSPAVIGHAVGAPSPGAWAGLTFGWDGTTLSATWDEGPTLSTALSSAAQLKITADGTLGIDELVVAWETPDPGDTGPDTGDTAPDTGDTAPDTGLDTAADTGLDTALDTGAVVVDTAPTRTAAQAYYEPGGFGCAAVPGVRPLTFLLALGALIRRWR